LTAWCQKKKAKAVILTALQSALECGENRRFCAFSFFRYVAKKRKPKR
jgi:hypothetical protein